MADALYRMKDEFYVCFTDLLDDMEVDPAFVSQVIEIFRRLDYFRECGGSGKL